MRTSCLCLFATYKISLAKGTLYKSCAMSSLLHKQKKTSSAADTAFSLVLSITRAARNPADFSSLIRAFRPSDFFWNACLFCLFCLYVCAAMCYTMVQRCERSTLTDGANQLAAP